MYVNYQFGFSALYASDKKENKSRNKMTRNPNTAIEQNDKKF